MYSLSHLYINTYVCLLNALRQWIPRIIHLPDLYSKAALIPPSGIPLFTDLSLYIFYKIETQSA